MYGDTPLIKILKTVAFHTLGIVPIEDTHHDVNKFLASLPAAEARKMRRKFRKLWRRAARGGAAPAYLAQLGLGNQTPDRKKKRIRKAEVLRRVHVEAEKLAAESAQKEEQKPDAGDTL